MMGPLFAAKGCAPGAGAGIVVREFHPVPCREHRQKFFFEEN